MSQFSNKRQKHRFIGNLVNLIDALEALIGALYLDAGIERCREFVFDILASEIGALSLDILGKDPKTELQEYLQAHHYTLPNYEILHQVEVNHEHQFTVRCVVPEFYQETLGKGSSRRIAEQSAALEMLAFIGKKR